MLVISRKVGQLLRVQAPATIEVLAVFGDAVQLAIDSPHGVVIEEPFGQRRHGDVSPEPSN